MTKSQQNSALASKRNGFQIEAVYRDYAHRLYGFFYAYSSGDAELAKDLVQETFYTALKKKRRFNPAKGSIETWLWTMARRRLIDALRKRSRRGPLPPIEKIEKALINATDDQPLPDEILERKETRLRIGSVLAALPQDYQNVLQRKYLEGESVRTIAQAKSVSEKAIESLLSRARQSFKNEFMSLSHEKEIEK